MSNGETNNESNIDANGNKVFVPFSEELLASAGAPLGELVPYQMEYRCVRLLDGTYEFDFTPAEHNLKTAHDIGHAA